MPESSEIQKSVLEKIRAEHIAGTEIVNRILSSAQEYLKFQVSFFDKLIVLNGGTLALSFSAAITVHSRIPSFQPVFSDILTAWKLLMVAIIAALLCIWCSIRANQVTSQVLWSRNDKNSAIIIKYSLKENVPGVELDKVKAPDTPKDDRLLKSAKIVGWIGSFTASVSILTTVASYYFLYRFANDLFNSGK